MDGRIVARLTTPTVIAVQLGALLTIVFWSFYGWIVGVVTLLVSLFGVWRAFQTGFVIDGHGLQMRGFLPRRTPVIPWSQLQSVNADVVIVGTEETRRKRTRICFFVEGQGRVQIIGCSNATIDAVLDRCRASGLNTQDWRVERPS